MAHSHHGHHHHHNHSRVHVIEPYVLPSDGVYALKSTGGDSGCGILFICPGPSKTCAINKNFLPDELEGKIALSEFMELGNKLDAVFGNTVMPMMPCALCHFVIPFSPVCAMFYCASQRAKGVAEVLEYANKSLLERGLYWEPFTPTIGRMDMIAVLKKNTAAFDRYFQGKTMIPSPSATVQQMPIQTAIAIPANMEMVHVYPEEKINLTQVMPE